MREPNCERCDVLWAEYERAIADQMDVLRQEHSALLESDPIRANSCEVRNGAADMRRVEARKRITEHHWAAHAMRSGHESTGVGASE